MHGTPLTVMQVMRAVTAIMELSPDLCLLQTVLLIQRLHTFSMEPMIIYTLHYNIPRILPQEILYSSAAGSRQARTRDPQGSSLAVISRLLNLRLLLNLAATLVSGCMPVPARLLPIIS